MPAQDFSLKVPNPLEGPPPGRQMSSAPVARSAAGETPGQTPESSARQAPEEVYGRITPIPTQEAPEGITYDFNDGLRVRFPETGGPWHIIFRDIDTGVVLYSQTVGPNTYVTSVKKFYVRFRLEIYHKQDMDNFNEAVKSNPYLATDKDSQPKPFFQHDYDATGKVVMIQLPVSTIGDTMGWFPYVEKFRQKHKCHILAVMQPFLSELFRKQYPEITFISPGETQECKPYATYYLGLFFKGDVDHQPCDFRYIGLHRTAGYILGVDPTEEKPRFNLSAPRQIQEPYVCIAAQSSSQAKYWNNPTGWHDVVRFLKDSGYRVLCMDRDRVHGQGIVYNHIPHGCEDFTGNRPLQERIDIIKDADMFIGLSSGLSWLAWGCNVPVVMISGFTNPTNEFYTPYRIINFHTCNSCWNDMRIDFDHYDYLWCPRHKGTDRQFECSRLISSEQVIKVIKSVPTFMAHMAGRE